MSSKVREIFEDAVWTIKAYAYQPFVPRKSIEWVLAHDCSYDGDSKKWAYYSCDEPSKRYPDGYTVKVLREANHAYCLGLDNGKEKM